MAEITVYHYHPESGLLLSTSSADMSPLEPEVPLVPAHATLIPPPDVPAGKVALYAEGAWSLVDAPEADATGAEAALPLPLPLDKVVQVHLDDTARSMGYRTIDSAVTYADEPAVAKFQREGRSLRAWRSKVWDAFITIQAAVEAGEREAPSAEDLVTELPAFELLPED